MLCGSLVFYVFLGIFRPACGLCNILLIPVTLNLAKAHTQTHRQTCKLNTDTYDSAHTQTHKTLEPVGNPGGRKLRVTQWRKHRRQGNEMLKQEENFMLTTTCNNMSEMHTHTHTHIQKHASRHTLPTGLD